MQVSYDDVEGHYYNSKFDSSLILYDSNYYTKDNSQLRNSISIFHPLIKRYNLLNIVDIGCGQGEYVQILNKLGIIAQGYDPALRESSSNLKKESFDPDKIENQKEKTFIMRCVLPHIENPFIYINSIFSRSPKSKIYVEFQGLEYLCRNLVWNSISHDHVSLFTIKDFYSRYNIIESGTFAKGEWSFVLFSRKENHYPMATHKDGAKYESQFEKIFESRSQQLNQLVNYEKPILIYGGAAKGIIFSHAFKSSGGGELFCIDQDSGREGKYLECSGVKVISPSTALCNFDPNTLILVMNKNHVESVNVIFENYRKVFTLQNFHI